ncbi:hypothetical protein LshimejAT787_0302460 [Lyophyllum shimeji]|uniref:Uncharacterized protein n=1 Tax=Lyophyllum shimeji TaxID=47721 RepID=A0A9P3PIA6_LYOSH|nr:hypothetical protein LshimejAT787_0302460 [Lyophyllum shimeji]
MEDIRNPMYAAEPYEESQGRDDSSVASPDALAAFYKNMEKKEILERKLSKRKSTSGTSMWSRKSVKRSATAQAAPSPAENSYTSNADSYRRAEHRMGEEAQEKEKENTEGSSDKPDWVPQMNSPRSIVPDSRELPAWYNKDAWASVPIPSYKLRYIIHNPVGPRWYKNHHLLPRSETTPAARPPSFFSPSFPPIASSISQDRPEDSTRLAGPSRTPSNSPTPNSSQTGVEKPRSRKTSQTAPDNVDLLDVTDPWGTNWHHQSPYDIGLSNGTISVDAQDALHTRSRRSSMTAQSRRRTAPSPLSQSMSAIHLQTSPDTGAHIPRKLSKRRTPTVSNIFGGKSQESDRNAVSLPTSPSEIQPPAPSLPKRMSVAPPNGHFMPMSQTSPSKKEKRGSVLGRLVKKFSILKKPILGQSRGSRAEDDWQHVLSDNPVLDPTPPPDTLPERESSPDNSHSDGVKRVPPPVVDEPVLTTEDDAKEADRSSCISFEAPFSIGRLTVANPDTPRSGETTPAQGPTPLPADKCELKESRVSSETYHPPTVNSTEEHTPFSSEDTPPPPPMKDDATSGGTRPKSIDLHRPAPPPDSSFSTPPAPSLLSHTSRSSVKDVQLPGIAAEKSTVTPAYSSASSAQNPSQAANQPSSRASDQPREDPLPARKARPLSVASSVPFPGGEAGERIQSFAGYENSPLSAASMLANPPTPYSNDIPIPGTPEYSSPALPPKIRTDTSSVPQVTRQTETFKLVRSPSGHVYASNETIVAGGQQWEVVGADDNKGKIKGNSKFKDRHARDRGSKAQDSRDRETKVRGKDRAHKEREPKEPNERESKERDFKEREKEREGRDRASRDRETSVRPAQKRESRSRAEPEPEADARPRRRSHREYHSQPGERSTSTPKTTRAPESDLRHRDTSTSDHQEVGKSHRRRDDGDRKSDRRHPEASSKPVNPGQTQSKPPAPISDAPPGRPPERRPSMSARPTSELPTAEELNALRAKEAWEMERLWKARSMQGEELNRYTTIPSNSNTPLMGRINDTGPQAALHGSSHTAFVVQTPFQGQHSIYHSMPTAPPPVIYSSPSSIPTITPQPPPTRRQSHSRFYAESIPSDRASYTSSVRPPNPLPEPPRESAYQIPESARNSEYWAKYAGVTASQ